MSPRPAIGVRRLLFCRRLAWCLAWCLAAAFPVLADESQGVATAWDEAPDPTHLLDLNGYLRLAPATAAARSSHAAMIQALELGRLADAVGYSRQSLEVERLPNRELGRLLIQSAILNLEADHREATGALLGRAVSLLEAELGWRHPDLILPVTLQGLLLIRQRQFEAARDRLQLGQYLVHLDLGVHASQQLPILEAVVSTHLATQGLFSPAAETTRRFMLNLHERRVGAGSPELVPALLELADWYNSVLCFEKAQRAQLRAVGILEEAFGAEDRRLVEPLMRYAKTRLALRAAGEIGFFSLTGRARSLLPNKHNNFVVTQPRTPQDCRYQLVARASFSLRPANKAAFRALAIVRADDQADPAELAKLLASLGDLLLVGSHRNAGDYYREAWRQLTDSGRTELRDSYFTQPQRIFPAQMDGMVEVSPDTPPADGPYALVAFEVSERGLMRNLKVVEATVDRDNQSALKSMLGSFRYRPRLVDGEAVATGGLRVRQSFPKVREAEKEAEETREEAPGSD